MLSLLLPQNILSKIYFITVFLAYLSLSFSLIPPIEIPLYENISFSLNEESKYVIYSFHNEFDILGDLVFRFSSVPEYSSKLFLFYSDKNIYENLDKIIAYDETTGECSNSFYEFSLDDLASSNFEIVLNKDNTESSYLK